jgi:hypothetical protein
MRYIKTFESFITDDNRGEDTQFPQHNAALKAKVVEYVDSILNSNEYSKLVKLLNMEMPKNISGEEIDKFFDDVREKAIEYFMKNPEEIDQTDGFVINKFNVYGGDGIVRTNNIGGTLRESAKPEPNKSDCELLEVTDDELAYFANEAPLLELIRDDKVTLYDNQIWYNKNDKETIDVLDTYFKIRNQEK